MKKKRQLILPALAMGALVSLGGLSTAQEEGQPVVTETTEVTGSEPTPVTNSEGENNMEVSVSELQQLLNSPTGGIREGDYDPSKPWSLFPEGGADPRIRDIFKGTPKFVYLPKGTDPMIIPWVRTRIIAEEMLADAKIFEANKDYDQAIAKLKEIREKAPNTPVSDEVPREIERIEKVKREAADANRKTPTEAKPGDTGLKEKEVVLPTWIAENTTAIMLGPEPVVVIGNDFLRPGDQVPRYAAVTIKSISSSEVVFEYQNKEFSHEVTGSF